VDRFFLSGPFGGKNARRSATSLPVQSHVIRITERPVPDLRAIAFNDVQAQPVVIYRLHAEHECGQDRKKQHHFSREGVRTTLTITMKIRMPRTKVLVNSPQAIAGQSPAG
jgi:hypothetical protein